MSGKRHHHGGHICGLLCWGLRYFSYYSYCRILRGGSFCSRPNPYSCIPVKVCRPSSVVRRPSSVVRHPSSVVRRPSSVVRRLYLLSSRVSTLVHGIGTFYCTYISFYCTLLRKYSTHFNDYYAFISTFYCTYISFYCTALIVIVFFSSDNELLWSIALGAAFIQKIAGSKKK